MTGDCVILVADNDIRAAVAGLLTRPQAIPMRAIDHVLIVHPQRDPGIRTRSRELLASYRQTHAHAIVILDREGCGGGDASAGVIEAHIEQACAGDWADRLRAIAIEPEVESWVWSDSPQVEVALGWHGRVPDLRDWLVAASYTTARYDKPRRPKEAFDHALRIAQRPRSSTIFESLGATVSVSRCHDTAFNRLRQTLQSWFLAP